MTETYYGFRLLLILVIVLANGFFAAAEVSLLTVRRSALQRRAEEGVTGARAALSLLARPARLLSVVQVGVTLSSLGLGWAGEETLYKLFLEAFEAPWLPGPALHGGAFALGFLVMSYLHVVLGEVVPKNLGLEKAERLAAATAPALLIFYRISEPFVWVIERSSAAVSRTLGLKGEGQGGGHSTEELKTVVTISRRSGQLPQAQEDMIHRVLELENLSVREIMVPRNQIVSIPVDSTLEQVIATIIRERHSRLPVWEDKPENIVGVLYSKDLLHVWAERRGALAAGRRPPEFRLRFWMRKHVVAPESKPVLQMLEEFREGGAHMALVVDEFGTISGLLTVEDTLEQIVGEIEDEYDDKKVEAPPAEAPVMELDGATSIRDLALKHGVEISSEAGFQTLAGFILMRLGYIPKAGESIEHDGHRFTVLEMERNRIARVRIERLEPERQPDTAASA